jgi:hypothetical protein
MTRALLRAYYIFATFSLYSNHWAFFREMPRPVFQSFAKPLSLFGFSDLVFPLAFILGLAFVAMSIFLLDYRSRIISSLAMLTLVSMMYSFGKVNHPDHIWMLSSVGMCFLRPGESLKSHVNLSTLRVLQKMVLCHSLFSGIWKAINFKLSELGDIGLEHIAYVYSRGLTPSTTILEILFNKLWVLELGYYSVIFFQLSMIYPILTGKFTKTFGILLVGFHLLTGLLLGLWFSNTVLGTLFLLVFAEFLLEEERDDPAY